MKMSVVCVVVGLCALMLTSFFGVSDAAKGVDVYNSLVSISSAQCMLKQNYTFALVGCVPPDSNCAHSVANFWAAGFSQVDLYFFATPSKGEPESQVQRLHSYVKQYNIRFDLVWLDIEYKQDWSSSQSFNVAFFKALVNETSSIWGQSRIGVKSTSEDWPPIMGSSTAGSGYPLWYAQDDGNPSFSDFSPFAGWTQPSVKMFSFDADLGCTHARIDLNSAYVDM
jgi:hypothetical protein